MLNHTRLKMCTSEDQKEALKRQAAADYKMFSDAESRLADDNLKVMMILERNGIPLYPVLGRPLIDDNLEFHLPTYDPSGTTVKLMPTPKITSQGIIKLAPEKRFTNKLVDDVI